MSKSLRRKIAKISAYSALSLLGLLVVLLTGVVLFLQGERLANLVNAVLPPMKGKLNFGSITFRPRLLMDLVTDEPTPMVVDGLKITDPEGTVALDVPHLEVSVRLKTLITGGGIVLSDLRVGPNSSWRFAAMKEMKGIGFLSSFDPKTPAPPPPPKPPGAPKEKGFVFQIVNAELNGFRATFDFPGSWGLDLRDIHAPASVLVDGEGFVGWDVPNLEARQGGYLRVISETLPFDSVSVKRVATTREWSDDIFLDLTAAKTGKTTLVGKGFFTGIYGANSVSGIKIHAEFENAVDALSAVAKPHNIQGLKLSGDKAKVVADLWDPYATMKIKADIQDLDVAYEAYRANAVSVSAGLEFATTDPTLTLRLEKFAFESPDGGEFRTSMVLAGDTLDAKLHFNAFKTGGYLPAGLKKLAGGTLSGGFGVAANLGANKEVAVKGLELNYSRAKDNLPQRIRISGSAFASPTEISTRGLKIDVPGAGADIAGKVELAKRTVGLALKLSTTDLPSVLARLGTPVARSAEANVQVSGSLDSPDANGQITVRGIGGGESGIPAVDKVATKFRLSNGTLDLESLALDVASGSITGQGEANLFQQGVSKLLAEPAVDFRLEGQRISLAELIGGGLIKGDVSFQLTATGTTKNPKVHFTLPPNTSVTVLGQEWRLDGIDVVVTKDDLRLALFQVAHPLGGKIQVEGALGFSKRHPGMSWKVRVVGMPLSALLATANVNAPVTGTLDLNLQAAGTMDDPRISGTILISKLVAQGTPLGNVQFDLSPLGKRGIQVDGNLLGKMALQAKATLAGKDVEAQARLEFDALHVEDFLPELQENGLRSTLAGAVHVDLPAGGSPTISATLFTVDASVTREIQDENGEKHPETLWVKNGNELKVTVRDGDVLLSPFNLKTQAGPFSIEGHLRQPPPRSKVAPAIAGRFSGRVDLGLLQPFFRGQVKELGGAMITEISVAGTMDAPVVNGTLFIAKPIRLVPSEMDLAVRLPSGNFHLSPSRFNVSNLALEVDGSTLRVDGDLGLSPTFSPTTLALKVAGKISARLLETLAPGAVSDVSGNATLLAEVKGTVAKPDLSAKIDLGSIQMRLRGLDGQVEVESGRIEVTSRELSLRGLRLRVANEGLLTIGDKRPGKVRLKSLTPTFAWQDIDLPLYGERLSFRNGNIEVSNLGFTMELSGTPDDGLELEGDLRLVSGRYLQDFNVSNLVLSPSRINESDSTPVWQDQPLLENLALNLRVRTVGDSFVVQNNLAPEIHILVDLGIGGTLAVPTLSGQIRPTDGRFHILGLRGDFELTPNVSHVTFVPTKSIAKGDTPELNLQAQNLLLDASGIEHTVLMRISGPIGQATIDLSTASGMDRNQTMLLLLSGRTTEAISGNTGPIFGMNTQSTISVIGQASRDTVSNLIEPYIDDTLQLLTGNHLNLRPTIGADGFEIRASARATREFDLDMSYLRGFQSQERYRGILKLWMMDYVTGRLIGDRVTYSLQQGIQQVTSKASVEMTVDYPLRGLPWK